MASETVYGPLIMFALAGVFGWTLFQGFRTGTMDWFYPSLQFSGDRQREPFKFWAAAVLNAIPFCLGLIGAAGMLIWPNGIGN